MADQFPEAPETYALRPGEVHVWKFALASQIADAAEMMDPLSNAEKERAARFRFEKDQARFISGRGILRTLLGRYTGIPPDKIVFRYEPQGKPALTGAAGWQFNLSHSRALGVAAFSRYDSVGIDIECVDPEFPREETAPEILTEDELRDLRSLPTQEQPAFFFQLWTMKEALVKAVGKGLSVEPSSIHMRLGEDIEIISAPPEFNSASLHRITVQKEFAGALAVLARVARVDFYEFRPPY